LAQFWLCKQANPFNGRRKMKLFIIGLVSGLIGISSALASSSAADGGGCKNYKGGDLSPKVKAVININKGSIKTTSTDDLARQ